MNIIVAAVICLATYNVAQCLPLDAASTDVTSYIAVEEINDLSAVLKNVAAEIQEGDNEGALQAVADTVNIHIANYKTGVFTEVSAAVDDVLGLVSNAVYAVGDFPKGDIVGDRVEEHAEALPEIVKVEDYVLDLVGDDVAGEHNRIRVRSISGGIHINVNGNGNHITIIIN